MIKPLDFLTKKTNQHTTLYAVYSFVVSVTFFFGGSYGIVRYRGGSIALEITCILIGVVFGIFAIWVYWVMRHEIIGLETDGQGHLNLLRQWGGAQSNVRIISKFFTLGCIRFGAPNDGRIDYAIVRTSAGVFAIPLELMMIVEEGE